MTATVARALATLALVAVFAPAAAAVAALVRATAVIRGHQAARR